MTENCNKNIDFSYCLDNSNNVTSIEIIIGPTKNITEDRVTQLLKDIPDLKTYGDKTFKLSDDKKVYISLNITGDIENYEIRHDVMNAIVSIIGDAAVPAVETPNDTAAEHTAEHTAVSKNDISGTINIQQNGGSANQDETIVLKPRAGGGKRKRSLKNKTMTKRDYIII